MKIHVFPPSGRVVGIVALKNYLALDCELKPIDLGRGDQRAPEYNGASSMFCRFRVCATRPVVVVGSEIGKCEVIVTM